MGVECCNLVGNFPIGSLEGIISVSSKGGTEMTKIGGNILHGPTTGTISISAYASKTVHDGCAGKAGVSLNWIKKYDCDNDDVYFIFAGEGKSYITGDVGSLITLRYPTEVVTYEIINASASSGPASVYQKENQTDSYGLEYTGGPWSFITSSDGEVVIDLLELSAGYDSIYLQSFSLTTSPNQVPTVSYEFVYTVNTVI
jgi:hypothetical protein